MFIKEGEFIVYSNFIYDNEKINRKFIYNYILLHD